MRRALGRLLCSIGWHNWRDMNGVCRRCRRVDPKWDSYPYLLHCRAPRKR